MACEIRKMNSISDPVTFFFDTQRKQSESYINHAKAFIVRAFPTIDKSILEQTLQEENHHFLSTVRKLERQFNIRTNAFLQRTAIRKSLDMLGMLFFTTCEFDYYFRERNRTFF